MSKDKLLVMFLLFQSPKSKQKACPNKLPPVRQCLGGQHTKLLLVSKVGFRQEFVLRDYLGNARVHFSDLNGDGALQPFACNPAVPCVPLGNGGGYTEMLQVQHYYPFGMEFDGPWEMPLDPDEINHYTYNGKELNRDFGLGWLDYGARWYDPAVGRFPSVDPIADQFAWVSPFNYAENEPIGHIDLWGLQQVPYPVAGLLRRLENLFSPALKELDNIKPNKEAQNRIDLVSRGLGKMGFGLGATFTGAYVSGQSFGAAAPVGAVIMFDGLTKTSIGMAQVIDGLFGEANSESILHQSSNGPGLVSYKTGVTNAKLIDAGGELLPGFLAGGWRGAVGLNDISSAVKFFKDGKLVYGALKSAQAINSGSNVFDFGDELMQSIPYSGSETPSSDNKGGSEDEIKAIKDFINNLDTPSKDD